MVVKVVENMEDFDNILASAGEKAIIVDFHATWCGPCKMIGPKLEGMSEEDEFKNTVIFLKVDVDEAEDIAERFNVSAMPTFIKIQNGKKVGECVGANEKKLREMVASQSEGCPQQQQ